MYMRGASGGMLAVGRQELGEFAGQEFAGVIAVESAYNVLGRVGALVQKGIERCEKATDVCRCFCLVLEKVDRFQTSVVVDDHEQVLKTGVLCADERSRDVSVLYEPPRAAQPSKRPWASEAGASAVLEGRARMRVEPAWRRACMQAVASVGDMTVTWWCVREA
eukprot:3352872-Pleurochrysis_carterae.AAC.1